jgi:signal transduction histidine kinase/DNA-binding response OmpR family regulator/HAMP domain-containing protein
MRLRDLRIGTQMKLGLGAILVLVVVLGAVAWVQADRLWGETQQLYNHPLMTRRAVGELKADVLAMHGRMSDLVLAGSDQERQVILQSIDTYAADADRQLAVLYDRYLGPRANIDDASDAFAQWKTIREEELRLLLAGEVAAATDLTKPTGAGSRQADMLLGQIQTISDFALNKGDEFYQGAQRERDSLFGLLWVVLGAVVLLSMGVGFVLLRSVRRPLKELTSATEAYRHGDLGARSGYVSANEFGALSASFNEMAETVQTDTVRREKAARMAEVMLREEELHAFCRELLKALIEDTGSQVGALYLLNDARTDFEHFDSIGLDAGARASFSAVERQGEFGLALATRQMQRITDIPADTRFTFSTVGCDLLPREIVTIPILSGHDAVAVISLASVRGYSPAAVGLVNDVLSVMTARLNGVLAFRKLREFSEALEYQNRELEAQKRELAVQAGELTEQNTELELQKRQLDEAGRLKSAFLSNMSHELRTPLNSVIALSGVLNRRLFGTIPEEEHGYLDVIERNGRHLLELINDVLDLSRIEAGRDEITVRPFTVRELTTEIVTMIEPQAMEKGIELRNTVPGDLPPLRSDFSKCLHILQNLVGNAVKFTDQGRVVVSARALGDTVEIEVADSGIGIASDQIRFIFDEFRQADESTTRNYGGTGLGLSIARKYALLLGGNIAVESAPGVGSTFTLRLPFTLEEPAAGNLAAIEPTERTESVAPEARVPASAVRGKNILLVEDSEPAIVQMLDILVEQGYHVEVARNGREALERIETAVPDAMILDLMMPEVDGFEVLRSVRAAEHTATIPVLILTAKHVTSEELDFLKGNHIHQMIRKGDVNRTELLAAVRSMVLPPREQRARRRRPAGRARTSGTPVILVVEDNPGSMIAAKALLKDTATVLEATDGAAGVEQALTHRPDLILMDLGMPVMDGFEALDAIREEEALDGTPVIAVTASAMKGDREEILAHGFDGYISKPIDPEVLTQTIREALGSD